MFIFDRTKINTALCYLESWFSIDCYIRQLFEIQGCLCSTNMSGGWHRMLWWPKLCADANFYPVLCMGIYEVCIFNAPFEAWPSTMKPLEGT